MANVFIGDVARSRGVSTATVLSKFGKGEVFVGQAAIDRGLADAFGSIDSLLGAPKGAATTAPTGATRGTMSVKATAPATAGDKEMECGACSGKIAGSMKAYCAKCYDGDDEEDDEEEEEAKSALLEITGAKSIAVAVATVQGWKDFHAERTAGDAAAKAEAKKRTAAEFDRAVEAYEKTGHLPKAAEGPGAVDHPRRVYALGLRAGGVEALDAYLASTGAIVKTSPTAEPASAPIATLDERSITLTPAEIAHAKAFNVPLEAMKKNKFRLLSQPAKKKAAIVSVDDEAEGE